MDSTRYIDIIITDGKTEKRVEALLPDDIPMQDLLPALAEELGICNIKNPRLMNETQGFEYDEKDTLISKGTKENDRCILIYDTISIEGVESRRARKDKKEQIKEKIQFRVLQKSIDEDHLPIDIENIKPLGLDELKGSGLTTILVTKCKALEKKCKIQALKLENLTTHGHSRINSAVYFIISQIVTGFGINLITQNEKGGWIVFVAGIVVLCGGIFYSFWPLRKKE